MNRFITSLLISIFLVGCSSDELDRDKAETIITEFYTYPYVEFVSNRSGDLRDTKKVEKRLIQDGFMTRRKDGTIYQFYDFILTEKGKAFYKGKGKRNAFVFASNELEFNEITGIRLEPGEKKATVDWNERRFNDTPFSILREENTELVNKSISMELFDDGWRIVGNSPKLSVKEDFQGFDKDYLKKIEEDLKNQKLIDNEIIKESSESYCYIKNIYKKYNKTFISVDFINITDSGVSNTNPKLRTFVLEEKTKIGDTFGNPFHGFGKIDDLNESVIENETIFLIRTRNGVVEILGQNTAG